MKQHLFGIAMLLVLGPILPGRAAVAPTRQEWTVDGVVREALVYAAPRAKTEASPVVFAFHGHGGTMNNAARTFAYQALWPDAIVVYPQGKHPRTADRSRR